MEMRLKSIRISEELLVGWLKTGLFTPARLDKYNFAISKGLPEDAQIKGVRFQPGWREVNGQIISASGTVELIFWSSKFDPVPEGQPIPILLPVVHTSRKVEKPPELQT